MPDQQFIFSSSWCLVLDLNYGHWLVTRTHERSEIIYFLLTGR